MATTNNLLPPLHPGEILREDLMKPLGITINQLARDPAPASGVNR